MYEKVNVLRKCYLHFVTNDSALSYDELFHELFPVVDAIDAQSL